MAEMFRVRRESAAGIARKFHRLEFIGANRGFSNSTELAFQFFADRIAEAAGFIRFNTAVLTCIRHDYSS